MKKITTLILIIVLITSCSMKSQEKEATVWIQTNYGNIKIKLYNETPGHRDNFLKLAKEGYYENLNFHRVIKDFMIQAGNLKADSVAAANRSLSDTISAEIQFPKFIHKRGSLAAARWGDEINPTKASSNHQFYLVTGKTISDYKLQEVEEKRFERFKQTIYGDLQSANMDTIKALYKEGNKAGITDLRQQWRAQAEVEATSRKSEILYTDEHKEIYKTQGGTPSLDNEYTVFGEVVSGMDVVDKIQNEKTNERDAPLQPVIIKAMVVE